MAGSRGGDVMAESFTDFNSKHILSTSTRFAWIGIYSCFFGIKNSINNHLTPATRRSLTASRSLCLDPEAHDDATFC